MFTRKPKNTTGGSQAPSAMFSAEKINWQLYEAGVDYKRSSELYENCRRNDLFYRGYQWLGSENSENLPKPVFNIVRRITDYLVSTVASGKISLSYLCRDKSDTDADAAVKALNAMADSRFSDSHLSKTVYSLLLSAALDGSAGLYCRFDDSLPSIDGSIGDIVTELIPASDIFPSDVNKPDVQSQDYIILSGRERVGKLKYEALCAGADEKTVKSIVADAPATSPSFRTTPEELDDGEGKATFIIKFFKKNGKVCFEKSTRGALIRCAETDMTLYPISYFNWLPARNAFFGTSPVSGLIPNQKYVNRAYAMVMKHMTDTAFSKVIYDKTKIPEWTNGIGEAVAVVGGGNVADAVNVIGVGKMQDGYMELIESAINSTKELAGATGAALGEVAPTNTSAILALAESSRAPLAGVRASYTHALEDIACVWADMSFAYMLPERIIGKKLSESDESKLRAKLTRAKVEIGDSAEFSTATTVGVLDKLLAGGYISAYDYISRLPEGMINDRAGLLAVLAEKNK